MLQLPGRAEIRSLSLPPPSHARIHLPGSVNLLHILRRNELGLPKIFLCVLPRILLPESARSSRSASATQQTAISSSSDGGQFASGCTPRYWSEFSRRQREAVFGVQPHGGLRPGTLRRVCRTAHTRLQIRRLQICNPFTPPLPPVTCQRCSRE